MASQYNYTLFFKGWAQCRLATDPDPDYEPRGVSGYTFALPGEPDMDRVINFQDRKGVVNRSFGPKVGVKVTGGNYFKTSGSGNTIKFEEQETIEEGHPMFGAAVDLLGKPKFSSHNSILVYNGYGIVNPVQLQVSTKNRRGKNAKISRSFFIDPDNPTKDLESIPIDVLTDYTISIDATAPPLPTAAEGADQPNAVMNTIGSPNMLYESGILEPTAFRQKRLENLDGELAETLLQKPVDRIKEAALLKRIDELKINDSNNRRTVQLGAKVLLPYALNSKQAKVNDSLIQAGPSWGLELWMGGWDADSMCFYVMGTVEISLSKDPLL